MFKLNFGKHRCCDGVSRREALRVGATGLMGGLALPNLLELQAVAASPKPAKAKACIFLMLEGGPSHIDMWDLKPNAPSEIRGPFHPISTNVPGTQIGNILPSCSKIADKYTIMRSHSHRDNAHQTGRHWVLTGYPPSFADGQAKGMPFNELYPSIGSIVSRELALAAPSHPTWKCPIPWAPAGQDFTARSTLPSRSKPIQSNPTLKCAT